MQVVCVSHNAPPLNDAEALCTARLLSAVVSFGVEVHLISAASSPTLEESIGAEILDSRIRITRVPPDRGSAWRAVGMLRNQFHGQCIEWVRPAIAAAKHVLSRCECPILLTRAFPMISNLVGYHCSSEARAWVAHFSDPFPPHEWRNHWYSPLLRPVNRRWARNILRRADLTTVTCPNAIRYIEEKTGYPFREKSMVVTHLALPKLKPGNFKLNRRPDEFVVAHVGNLMTRRRPDLLLAGAMLAMEKHAEIRFLQYGNVDREILDRCKSSPVFNRLDVRHVDNLSPRDAADLQEQVDVNVIVDTDLGLSYSPFILSKYPHSVCAGRPMLMLSAENSEMARMTTRHGGGEFVPFSTPEAVAQAICRLFARRNETTNTARLEEYQAEFSAERVVRPFLERLKSLV